jgi:hypothetical protein
MAWNFRRGFSQHAILILVLSGFYVCNWQWRKDYLALLFVIRARCIVYWRSSIALIYRMVDFSTSALIYLHFPSKFSIRKKKIKGMFYIMVKKSSIGNTHYNDDSLSPIYICSDNWNGESRDCNIHYGTIKAHPSSSYWFWIYENVFDVSEFDVYWNIF